jgi:hypothetical protein
VKGKGWVKAKELKVGDSIRKANGSSGKVKAIKIEQSTQEMYNLTVDQAHTYFVGEGQWLVHNTNPYVSKALSEGLPQRISEADKTTGYLFDENGNLIQKLTSGRNPYSFDTTLVRGYNRAFLIQDHVEAQAAGVMRDLNIPDGTLVLNNIPCSGGAYTCENLLESMLSEGSSLRVIVPDGFDPVGAYDLIFNGIP